MSLWLQLSQYCCCSCHHHPKSLVQLITDEYWHLPPIKMSVTNFYAFSLLILLFTNEFIFNPFVILANVKQITVSKY